MSYALDRASSSFEGGRPRAAGTHFTLRQHFAVPRLPAPQPPGATPPNPAALPNPPSTVPDARSLFVSIAYMLAPSPAEPSAQRAADPRVGYFTRSCTNFGNDNSEGRKEHVIRRWRLEKKDPAAAVSEPKEAIRVVLDHNIPEKWREPVRLGILEWNKAFERAGFRNAIALEQHAADADWSSLEGTHLLSVRWFAQEGPGATAVGPGQSDPRAGEMLRGAAIIPENWVRNYRARAGETVPRFAAPIALPAGLEDESCTYAEVALEDSSFAFALPAERGDIDPNGPEGEGFIAGALKDVVMHEVDHALGLRLCFRASVGITPAHLRDPAFAAANGVSNSVMDYNASNVPLDGERVPDYHMGTLGAYDYWAIDYGYRQYANVAEEAAGLAALAARSEKEPALAYASDEDVGGVYTTRAMAGARQPLMVSVPAPQQRAALDLVVNEVFSSHSFRFDPAKMSRLAVDPFDRSRANRSGDFSLPDAVAGLLRLALDKLMSDTLAARLANAESKPRDPSTLPGSLPRAHLEDSASTLSEALKAPPVKQGV